jgi:hypothetical protein
VAEAGKAHGKHSTEETQDSSAHDETPKKVKVRQDLPRATTKAAGVVAEGSQAVEARRRSDVQR